MTDLTFRNKNEEDRYWYDQGVKDGRAEVLEEVLGLIDNENDMWMKVPDPKDRRGATGALSDLRHRVSRLSSEGADDDG